MNDNCFCHILLTPAKEGEGETLLTGDNLEVLDAYRVNGSAPCYVDRLRAALRQAQDEIETQEEALVELHGQVRQLRLQAGAPLPVGDDPAWAQALRRIESLERELQARLDQVANLKADLAGVKPQRKAAQKEYLLLERITMLEGDVRRILDENRRLREKLAESGQRDVTRVTITGPMRDTGKAYTPPTQRKRGKGWD